ncbi:MAG: homoprotocatechuate degradation operon regulator HpaR [Pseudomonadota bacterium]|jgi:homoprotocatechuate degradation regulator HpaR
MTLTRKISYRNLPQLLMQVREALLSNFRPILNHYGLTEQQWRIMRTLSERDQLEPRELCEACHILSPSLAGVLARMEDMGLVQRSPFPDDQRRQLVRLSERSEALVTEIAPLVEEQYRHIEAAFGKALIGQLYNAIDRVLLSEHPPVQRVSLPALPAQTSSPKPAGSKRPGRSRKTAAAGDSAAGE